LGENDLVKGLMAERVTNSFHTEVSICLRSVHI